MRWNGKQPESTNEPAVSHNLHTRRRAPQLTCGAACWETLRLNHPHRDGQTRQLSRDRSYTSLESIPGEGTVITMSSPEREDDRTGLDGFETDVFKLMQEGATAK